MATSDLKRLMIPGALVVGGITAGSMLAPVALAAADDDPSDSTESAGTTEQATDSAGFEVDAERIDRRGRGRHRHLAHHPGVEALTETLGLTAQEIRAAFAGGMSLADIAADQGVSVDELQAALVEAATERIDEAVSRDRIDADRAAELKAELDDRIGEMINRTPGERFDGEGHGRRRGLRGAGADVAEFLGLTTDDLRAAFSEGRTLAEVAEAQGVSEDDLVAFLLEQLEARLDRAVENGRFDADDVEDRLADAEERIEERINAEPGEWPGGLKERHRRAHGHPGFHGDRDDSGTDGETVESSFDV